MSEINFHSLSISTHFADAVYPFLDASMDSVFQTTFMIHKTIIHPWSTFFEHKGQCSKIIIAPSGATGARLLELIGFHQFHQYIPINYARNEY